MRLSQIHFAAVYGHHDMLTAMLDECPDLVATPNRQGWRPLHFAAGFGRTAVIDLLLARGADLKCTNDISKSVAYGARWTPLHRAFRWWLDPAKPNAIRHLLLLGADPTALDAAGKTPVDYVSDASSAAAIEALAEAEAAGHGRARLVLQDEATRRRMRAAADMR